jgi:uncharacterized membrane protein YcaP (DUF421 family)
MKLINKIFFVEKITAINLTKIIHRVIISIDLRVFHTIVIIVVLIVINLASRSLIAFSSFLYLTNSREKIVS